MRKTREKPKPPGAALLLAVIGCSAPAPPPPGSPAPAARVEAARPAVPADIKIRTASARPGEWRDREEHPLSEVKTDSRGDEPRPEGEPPRSKAPPRPVESAVGPVAGEELRSTDGSPPAAPSPARRVGPPGPRKRLVLPAGTAYASRASALPSIPLLVAILLVAIVGLYLLQPPVRRRLRLAWRARRLRSRTARERSRAQRLALDEARVETSDIEAQALKLLAANWLREIDGAPGIGPALVEEIRAARLPAPPHLRESHLLTVRGIGEARAHSMVRHLASAELRYRSQLATSLREGRLALSAEAEDRRARIAADLVSCRGDLAALERDLDDARDALARAPVLRFRTFLARLLTGRIGGGAVEPALPERPAPAASPGPSPPLSPLPGPRIPPPRAPALLQALLEKHGSGPVALLPVREIATALAVAEGSLTQQRTSEILARRVVEAGFGIEPDAAASGKAYAAAEKAALFAAVPGEVDRERYLAASSLLRFGIAVALADGAANPLEVERIAEEIESAFPVTPPERRRLDGLRALLADRGSGLDAIERAFTARLDAAGRRQVAEFLVAVAGADGTITPPEAEFLRKAFRKLRVPVAELDRILEGLGVAEAKPVLPVTAAAGPLKLDRDAIDRILAQSQDVARLLADAMAGQPEPGPPAETPPAVPARAPSAAGVPGRYLGFYEEIIVRERWPIDEAEGLARRHGHMLAGAIEALNDWAFEVLGGPILSEDESAVVVDMEMLKRVEA